MMFALAQAHQVLKAFDCVTPNSNLPNYESVRESLLLVVQQSDYQILGICAETAEQGIQALHQYCHALGYEIPENLNSIPGVVYIKYNPKTGLCYMDSYAGDHRGVLVSCQSAYDTGINDMYGHLPLDLFN